MSELFCLDFANLFDIAMGVCLLVIFLSLTIISVGLVVLVIKDLIFN